MVKIWCWRTLALRWAFCSEQGADISQRSLNVATLLAKMIDCGKSSAEKRSWVYALQKEDVGPVPVLTMAVARVGSVICRFLARSCLVWRESCCQKRELVLVGYGEDGRKAAKGVLKLCTQRWKRASLKQSPLEPCSGR